MSAGSGSGGCVYSGFRGQNFQFTNQGKCHMTECTGHVTITFLRRVKVLIQAQLGRVLVELVEILQVCIYSLMSVDVITSS